MNSPVIATVEGRIGVIELANPDKFNCLSSETWRAIDAAHKRFESDNAVRAILIRAQGKHFCTGADLDEVKSVRGEKKKLEAFIACGMDALVGLESSPLPVVAAAQGLSLAGGMELILGTDVVFAAQSAKFGDQHAQYGLIPGWGGSQRLVRKIGTRQALDLMISARWLAAEEAKAVGLVNYVVQDDALHDEAMTYCVQLAERSRSGLAEMKRLAHEGAELGLAEALALEAEAAVDHIMSDDAVEGLAAFEARRDPVFN